MAEFETWQDANTWATDSDVDDPLGGVLPEPVGWRILVRPMQPREKTEGGVIVPDQARDNQAKIQTVGRILAVGPQAWSREDMGGPWAKVGDYVLFGKWAGQRFECDGVKLVILNDDEITAVVPKPEVIRR